MQYFKKYKRTQIAEMRPVIQYDIEIFNIYGAISLSGTNYLDEVGVEVSISRADLKNGSPKIGDMIARNPKNHQDQWLVAEQYFKDNFEEGTEDYKHKWIKIESEADLPTEYGEYIVRLKSGKVKGAAYYAESKRFYTGGNVNDNPVTHWIPLPEPPKED